jgi:hypothetical protein
MVNKTENTTEEQNRYELVKVPTGEALAIQTPSGEFITPEMAIVEILNVVKSIEKSVA